MEKAASIGRRRFRDRGSADSETSATNDGAALSGYTANRGMSHEMPDDGAPAGYVAGRHIEYFLLAAGIAVAASAVIGAVNHAAVATFNVIAVALQ
jgi:hypothetical protein